MKKKKIILLSIISFLVLAVVAATATTIAYLTSRRNATGLIQFAPGILIEYSNVTGTASQTGNLLQYDEDEEDNLAPLNVNGALPGDVIKLANPTLTPQENTAHFALRAKLVITIDNDSTLVFNGDNENDGYRSLTGNNTVGQDADDSYPNNDYIFESGIIEFDEDYWEYNEEDGYYYYVDVESEEEDLADKLIECDDNTDPITIFTEYGEDEGFVTLTVTDEPIEQFIYQSLNFELKIEAVQFTRAAEIWELD